MQHPDQLAMWRAEPDLGPTAIDELLRFDSPVQLSRRIALRDLEIQGFEVPAGAFVLTSLGSANHDPAAFGPTADQLDLRRSDAARHLSFGSGTHHCLGAALARLQGAEAIGGLVRRFPGLEPAADPAWNGRLVLRGMESLPLTLGP